MNDPLPEVDVTADLVRALLRDQHPDLAGLPLRPAGLGWDNVLWRLGDTLAVRLPVRAAAAPLVLHEQRWLGRLAPQVTAAVPVGLPVPVRTGRPAAGYPWPWSIVPWFDGSPAWTQPVAERTAWATDLADVLLALHVPAPPDAPSNPVRGVPLPTRSAALAARLDRLVASGVLTAVEAARVRTRWADLSAAPGWSGPAQWPHGDPHPANLLVRAGRLRAVLDFGDVTSGDPASDLATAWLTFDAAGRAVFRARCADARLPGGTARYDDGTWGRAHAWALHLSLVLLGSPPQHPHLHVMGRHGLDQSLAD